MASKLVSAEPSPPIPLHIVEDHNEALEYIYNAIGAKRLPFTGVCFVHLDSHPDLLSPDIPTDHIYDKETLLASLSIADWILPAVYAGHFECVVWVKPPWACQIQDGRHMLIVGKHRENNKIRVNLPIPYYLSEGLFASNEELDNIRSIPLHVFTVGIPFNPKDNFYSELKDIVNLYESWILDIDLDFFSTLNPFKDCFTPEQFGCFKELYEFKQPRSLSLEGAVGVNREREEMLSRLYKMWSSQSVNDSELVQQIKAMIGVEKNGRLFNAEDMHTVGIISDVPHHLSTKEEIELLMESTKYLLEALASTKTPIPKLITMARSSEDDYTPPSQVEYIQQLTVGMLQGVYQQVLVQLHYTAEEDIESDADD